MSVVCKNLSVIKKNKIIYDNISFEALNNEFVMIYDLNSEPDLLYALAGIERAKRGSVYINGREINIMSEKDLTSFRRRNISLIFHENNLISGFNILENIMLPLELGNVHIEKSRIDFVVNLFRLNGKMYLTPSFLSYYEQLCVSFARAQAAGAGTIFLYNIEKNLSDFERKEINKLLLMCRERLNKTIVYLCADERVDYECDKKYFIKDGRLC